MNIIDVLADKYSHQEIFDFTLAKMLEQARPSNDPENEYCAYRGANGTMCAIGHMIPDELYYSAIEREPVDEIVDTLHIPVKNYKTLDLLSRLQGAHDSASIAQDHTGDFLGAFKTKMREVARDYGLVMSD